MDWYNRRMFELKVDEHLAIRPYRPQDAATLFRLIDTNRDHIGKYLVWVEGTKAVAESAEFINETLPRVEAGKTLAGGIWQDGELIGGISLEIAGNDIHEPGEIGYWLAASATRKGVMTRCVRALGEYGHDKFGLTNLLIRARPDNHPSAQVAMRIGYKHVGRDIGVQRQGNHTYDLDRYVLALP